MAQKSRHTEKSSTIFVSIFILERESIMNGMNFLIIMFKYDLNRFFSCKKKNEKNCLKLECCMNEWKFPTGTNNAKKRNKTNMQPNFNRVEQNMFEWNESQISFYMTHNKIIYLLFFMV